MKILLDARMYGLEHRGIGRYVENLVKQLSVIDYENEYALLVRKSQIASTKSQIIYNILNTKYKILQIDIPHYSLREQIDLPRMLSKLDFDLVHFPHFNVPLPFNRPFVVTIHDLIKHASRGTRTTTRSPMLYWPKYVGYKLVFNHAVKAAKKIIVPSNAVKADLLANYDIPGDKVVVIYEGVDKIFNEKLKDKQSLTLRGKSEKSILDKHKVQTPYMIYTGNVYPHKNVERLIQAAQKLELNLIIVGSRNVFRERLEAFTRKNGAEKFVNFLGFVEDSELAVFYRNAQAFVFPSLSEGFGLPGLEAMATGCPVICSDIPVFQEIYGNAAVYFDPESVNDMVDKIKSVLTDRKTRLELVNRGKIQADKFSWRKMAVETLKVYIEVDNEAFRIRSLRYGEK